MERLEGNLGGKYSFLLLSLVSEEVGSYIIY